MSIDRIGKGGVAVPPGTGGVGSPAAPTSGAGRTFEVRRSETPAPAESIGHVEGHASPLERLRAGEIDLNTYMDLKVFDATAHLVGLGPSELGAIQRILREKLASDPALADLVKGATGQSPVPQDE